MKTYIHNLHRSYENVEQFKGMRTNTEVGYIEIHDCYNRSQIIKTFKSRSLGCCGNLVSVKKDPTVFRGTIDKVSRR